MFIKKISVGIPKDRVKVDVEGCNPYSSFLRPLPVTHPSAANLDFSDLVTELSRVYSDSIHEGGMQSFQKSSLKFI